MIQQNIYMGNEGRKKLLNGVKKLANAVSSTLGPGGRNVIYRMGNATYITKDGVTVARHVNPPDVLEKWVQILFVRHPSNQRNSPVMALVPAQSSLRLLHLKA